MIYTIVIPYGGMEAGGPLRQGMPCPACQAPRGLSLRMSLVEYIPLRNYRRNRIRHWDSSMDCRECLAEWYDFDLLWPKPGAAPDAPEGQKRIVLRDGEDSQITVHPTPEV